jgi:hypothetical protein
MAIKQTNNCIKKILLPGFLYAALLFMNGCQKTNINFGSQFADNNYTQLIKVDTTTLQFSTRFYDSIQTNGTGTVMAGIYSDPLFGTVRASSYLKLIPPHYYNDTDYSRTTFDSLVLIIKPNGHYYGDTTKPVHLNVYRLAATVQPRYNNGYYYNFDSITKYPAPLGSTDFLYYPHNQNSDSAVIRLSDDMGLQLLSRLKSKDASIQSNDNFQAYFFGLCISSGSNPASVINFSDSVVMRLYYQNPGVITYEAYKDFTFNDASNQFNNISIDRTGTALATVTPDVHSVVSSTLTNNASYLQAVTGTAAKISFPTLRSILQIPYFIKIAKAILVLKPVQGSFSHLLPMPDSLRLSETDLYNNVLGDIMVSNGSGTSSTLIGNLTVDYLYGYNTAYTFDITGYINTIIATGVNNGASLLVSPPQPNFSTRFDRVVFDNSSNVNYQSQLLVYYITVQ